jgi:hypothetical protein
VLGDAEIGYIEVETFEQAERLSRHGSWGDVGNLHVRPEYQRRGGAHLAARAGRRLAGTGAG